VVVRNILPIHHLRYVFARALNEQNVPIDEIALLLRHKRSRLTERYAHRRDPRLRGYQRCNGAARSVQRRI